MAFEDYECSDNSFDMIYSASAFHWIPEETGYSKVYRLLKSGGTFARFDNHPYKDKENEPLHVAMQRVYTKYIPHADLSAEYNDESSYAHFKIKEIGYVLSKAYWGKGLMPEAVTAVIRFCFNKYKLDALTICHFSSNNQSKKVIEKCGFTFAKQSEHYANQLELTFDGMQYILLNKAN
ncbi:MAG: acetyltransferase, ribosomal protein N-acetylase [Clostridium sp. Maddingley MBC34-26]|nr:MAG: acetyltransferase, ribosomal protein N-acetylase [Clostridium sp. Maddingley MBC34-26]